MTCHVVCWEFEHRGNYANTLLNESFEAPEFVARQTNPVASTHQGDNMSFSSQKFQLKTTHHSHVFLIENKHRPAELPFRNWTLVKSPSILSTNSYLCSPYLQNTYDIEYMSKFEVAPNGLDLTLKQWYLWGSDLKYNRCWYWMILIHIDNTKVSLTDDVCRYDILACVLYMAYAYLRICKDILHTRSRSFVFTYIYIYIHIHIYIQ